MYAPTIDLLTSYDPETATPRKITAGAAFMHAPDSWLHEQVSQSFVNRYSNVAFGWRIANQFAKYKMKFPVILTGRDQWVFKAYLMLLNPRDFFNVHIADAFHLCNHKVARFETNMKALVMSIKDGQSAQEHIQQLSRKTGLPEATIEAFEILFFNVLDRRADALVLANTIYPATRAVEFDDNYFKTACGGDIIIRTSYNNKDIELTSYLLGLGDSSYMAKLAASENREAELSRHIASNGILLTRTGLLNQQMIGLSRATTLMAASRQGGTQAEDPITNDLYDSISSQLEAARLISQENTIAMMREDAGEWIEADVVS